MPISSLHLFFCYNHLLLFTGPHLHSAYSFNNDHEYICHLIYQILLLARLSLIASLNAPATTVKYSPVEWYCPNLKYSSRFCTFPRIFEG